MAKGMIRLNNVLDQIKDSYVPSDNDNSWPVQLMLVVGGKDPEPVINLRSYNMDPKYVILIEQKLNELDNALIELGVKRYGKVKV